MKNIFILIVIALCLYGLSLMNNNKQTSESSIPKSSTKISLSALEGIDYAIKDIPDNVMNYLLNNKFQNVSKDKKIVRYFAGAGCPYGDAFTNAVRPYSTNSSYSSSYVFYQESLSGFKRFKNKQIAQADIAFENLCKEFCIINISRHQVFRINGVGYQEAAKVPSIIEQLKDW